MRTDHDKKAPPADAPGDLVAGAPAGCRAGSATQMRGKSGSIRPRGNAMALHSRCADVDLLIVMPCEGRPFRQAVRLL